MGYMSDIDVIFKSEGKCVREWNEILGRFEKSKKPNGEFGWAQ